MVRWQGKIVVAGLAILALVSGARCVAQSQEEAAPAPTLYERLGGAYGVAVLVDAIVDRVSVNESLVANPYVAEAFARVPLAGLKFQVTAMLCAATGGPETYQGRSMRDAHAHLRITPPQWQAFVQELQAALAAAGIGERETTELLALVETSRDEIVTASAPTPHS